LDMVDAGERCSNVDSTMVSRGLESV
jgi:hypothetical protein